MAGLAGGRFQELIEQLLAEHEEEVRCLKEENSALREQLLNPLSPDDSVQEPGSPKLQVELQDEDEEPRRDSSEVLRQEADETNPSPEAPAAVVKLGEASRSARIPPPLESDGEDESGESKERGRSKEGAGVQTVRAIFHRLSALPASALQGQIPARCSVVVKSGEMSGETKIAALNEEMDADADADAALPHAVSHDGETTFKCDWGDNGADVLLYVPSAMLDEYMLVEIQCEGLGTIATGQVKLNAHRQPWKLDRGVLDAEIHLEKVTTPSGQRRTSTTTRARIVERLEKLFDVKDPSVKLVMSRDLGAAMDKASQIKSKTSKRQTARFESALHPEELDEVMGELKRIHDKVIEKTHKTVHAQPVISWHGFVECMLLSDLPKFTHGPLALNLFIVQRELLGDEMPASGTSVALLMAYEKSKKPKSRSQRWVSVVTALSTGAIIISFIMMGVALDTDPELQIWLALDTIVAMIFVAEVVVKSYVLTPKAYFFGRDGLWNSFDVGLSLVAVAEIVINIIFTSAGAQAKAALILRGLRLARMARLAKLIRMPLLSELANLISGFVLSVRSLFWVMIFLTLIVYVIALGFRAGVQTFSDQVQNDCSYKSNVFGDYYDLSPELNDELPAGCKLHYMYGLEFCSSVMGCMFSIFRCMISECTTTGGRSLTMVFSDGIGLEFDAFYAISMVAVIFGLFNIITAIFVEATLNGLKENEVQRRYAKAYESSYMTEQLAKLVMTVSSQVQKLRSRTDGMALLSDTFQKGLTKGMSMGNDAPAPSNALQKGEIYLSEEEFNQLVRHPDVRLILNDLDVNVEPRPGIFEAFNTEEDGTVSLSELVSGLMRLRGELHKVDMVIAQMSLDNVVKQVMDVKKVQAELMARRKVTVVPRAKIKKTDKAPPKAVVAP